MLHVPLARLDQVGDQVVPPLELDVDLGPGVLHPLLETNQGVVDADDDYHQDNEDDEQYRTHRRPLFCRTGTFE